MASPNITEQMFFVEEMEALREKMIALDTNWAECLDTIWMLVASSLVFFMHAGFSLLEAGCVRFKNAQNILAKNLIVVSLGFLCWYVIGWPLAYGIPEKPNKFIGGTEFFMDGFMDDKTKLRNWFFQGAFCATGGTIVSGAMAERTQLKGFIVFIMLMTSWIYPVVVYWGWSGHGFLTEAGFIDFAGSGIVHLVGGVAALLGSIIVGPRTGRFGAPDSDFDAHNVPFSVLGTFALWFGWYGFNPGSTLAMKSSTDAYSASLVACNTTMAPCIAGLVVFFIRARLVEPMSLDVGGFCNGILAGLVSITAACAQVQPQDAMVIGFVGGFLYQGASMTLKKFHIDDVVDAFPVHGVCGFWGIIAVGLFGGPEVGGKGMFADQGASQLWAQFWGALVIVLWVATWSLMAFLPLRLLGMLRLTDHFQKTGADAMEHSPSKAYAPTEPKASMDEHTDS